MSQTGRSSSQMSQRSASSGVSYPPVKHTPPTTPAKPRAGESPDPAASTVGQQSTQRSVREHHALTNRSKELLALDKRLQDLEKDKKTKELLITQQRESATELQKALDAAKNALIGESRQHNESLLGLQKELEAAKLAREKVDADRDILTERDASTRERVETLEKTNATQSATIEEASAKAQEQKKQLDSMTARLSEMETSLTRKETAKASAETAAASASQRERESQDRAANLTPLERELEKERGSHKEEQDRSSARSMGLYAEITRRDSLERILDLEAELDAAQQSIAAAKVGAAAAQQQEEATQNAMKDLSQRLATNMRELEEAQAAGVRSQNKLDDTIKLLDMLRTADTAIREDRGRLVKTIDELRRAKEEHEATRSENSRLVTDLQRLQAERNSLTEALNGASQGREVATLQPDDSGARSLGTESPNRSRLGKRNATISASTAFASSWDSDTALARTRSMSRSTVGIDRAIITPAAWNSEATRSRIVHQLRAGQEDNQSPIEDRSQPRSRKPRGVIVLLIGLPLLLVVATYIYSGGFESDDFFDTPPGHAEGWTGPH
ncbi:hypothetical protein PENSPDRAFT_669358 [Peniophora sp. CONT]|nr:hypothetical protein PENSPDRAFT_669358 [Peniophora sp. CONT]